MKNIERPTKFDANVLVIGAGSAGLIASYIAAAVQAEVILVQSGPMGGDCLNTGCVPSKSLISIAHTMHQIKTAGDRGITVGEPRVDFPKVMNKVQQAINTIAPNDSVERYESLGVRCVTGRAQFLSPYCVAVNGREYTAANIIIATGAEPALPPIPGLESVDYVTSETLWNLKTLPDNLVVLGGGPIGCELAQSFQRLGSEVTLVEMASRLLPQEHADISAHMARLLQRDGVRLMMSHKAERILPHRLTV